MLYTAVLWMCLGAGGDLRDAGKSGEGASPASPAPVALKVSLSKERLLAGENVDIHIVLENPTDQPLTVSPLQCFAFVSPRVEGDGRVFGSAVEALLASYDQDVTLLPHRSVEKWVDLATWYPVGLPAGQFTFAVAYTPERKHRKTRVLSNKVSLEVLPRSEVEEEEWQAYVAALSARSKDMRRLAENYLDKYPKSVYTCRVRILAATVPGTPLTLVDEMLGESFEGCAPTRRELALAHEFRARAYEENGRLEDAVALLALIDEPWAKEKKAGLERTIAFKKEKEQQRKDEVGVPRTP
jgi:hypothetical protein